MRSCVFAVAALLSIAAVVRGDEAVCPDGMILAQSETPISSNGCGTAGISVVMDDDFTPCCDLHDACYGLCGVPRDTCEKEFKSCLKNFCSLMHNHPGDKKKAQCESNAVIMAMGAQMGGASAFEASQKEACECLGQNFLEQRYITHAERILASSRYKEKKVKEFRKKLLRQDGRKGYRVLLDLLKDHPKGIVKTQKQGSSAHSGEL